MWYDLTNAVQESISAGYRSHMLVAFLCKLTDILPVPETPVTFHWSKTC